MADTTPEDNLPSGDQGFDVRSPSDPDGKDAIAQIALSVATKNSTLD
ncbi:MULTISPECIES: hypothetical protein [unclassified Frondihabitans]|nr:MULTISPECIES: hypothetical protein [unclassified Frondihabitans]